MHGTHLCKENLEFPQLPAIEVLYATAASNLNLGLSLRRKDIALLQHSGSLLASSAASWGSLKKGMHHRGALRMWSQKIPKGWEGGSHFDTFALFHSCLLYVYVITLLP